MIKNMAEFTYKLNENGGGHILYFTEKLDDYVQNAVEFIISGIKNNEYVLFVENEPINLLVSQKLENILGADEIKRVHQISNFDFYCSTGNFHTVTILNYFFNTLDPYFDQNLKIRCWGHVEWPTQKHINSTLKEFEFEVDRLMPEMDIIGVCAYNLDRLTKEVQKALMECHGYLMTDNEIMKLVDEADGIKKIF
ncbi:MEDS domain-containing protein [Metabacillus litoralis]|uniref:MEDS domain-containing protein n=1 Tax=Metabacillus TaxID=2675233 RepID=UPI000EF5CC21|nr:MEDS domain-containing protein [Metabacillus litoralis]MCM3160282.1 MEDS domain-containing protein [Metabacillus litoralis]